MGSNNKTNVEQPPYIGAPYNFVPLCDEVLKLDENSLIDHGEMTGELLSGELTYKITAETPIFVGNGKQRESADFAKNMYGEYAIPGSTMRGLIRNNVQIVSMSSVADDIDDYALMYREIAGGKNSKRYRDILGSESVKYGDKQRVSILKNVKAGYIANENGKYVIYRTDCDKVNDNLGDMNYHIVSEKKLVNGYIDKCKGIISNYEFFFDESRTCFLQHTFNSKIEKCYKKGSVHYEGEPNCSYVPYYEKVKYEAKGINATKVLPVNAMQTGELVGINPPQDGLKDGYVISTGYMNEKKKIYVIPNIRKDKPAIELDEKDVKAYMVDYNRKLKALLGHVKEEKNKAKVEKFYSLPKPGEEARPVFYIEPEQKSDKRVYFGYTPYLRLFCDYTIANGINSSHKESKLDFAKIMFGYTSDDNGSYKSRLSFSDAVICGGNTSFRRQVKAILAEPKPTCYCNYIDPAEDGSVQTYNSKDFKIRGVKQYWLKDSVEDTTSHGSGNDNIKNWLLPLPEKTEFKGKIRFENLKKEELGLLIFSITLKLEKDESEDVKMNIGMGKPYGYGRVKISDIGVRLFNYKKAYNASAFESTPWDESLSEDDIYTYVSEFVGKSYGSNVSLDKLKYMKTFIAPYNVSKYMSLKDFKEQKKKCTPLPTTVSSNNKQSK